jgi:glutamate--cysteine ligase
MRPGCDEPDQQTARPTDHWTADTPITPTDIPTLATDFCAGARPAERWAVGAEYEALGLIPPTLTRLPYRGPKSVERVLQLLHEQLGGQPRFESGNLVAIERGATSITIEPGGQVEFSGSPHARIVDLAREVSEHRQKLAAVAAALDIRWLWLGLDPLHSLDAIELMPKARYRMMYRYLPTRGALAPRMMKQTCAVQCSVDYSGESDAAEKIRVACALSPLVTGMTANSPFLEGRATGYLSFRSRIWRDVDPDRCGIPPFFLDGSFDFGRYVDYVLDIPMFFIMRGGTQVDLAGLPFRRFLAEGRDGHHATYGDWLVHTSTAFPVVRVKRHLELRNMDALPPALHCALPALWRGVLYDPEARAAAAALAVTTDLAEVRAAQTRAARHGLRAPYGRATVGAYAKELVAIAREGLERLAHARGEESDVVCLEPLMEQVEAGLCPADHLIRSYEAAGGGRAGVMAAIWNSVI